MDAELQKAKDEAIAHWDRMIVWAKKQNPNETAYSFKMWREIDENWSGEYCALCKLFPGACSKCPMPVKCSSDNSVWAEVYSASTWGEWVTAADKMPETLRAL